MKNPLHLRFQSGFLPFERCTIFPVYWLHENSLNCTSSFSNIRLQTLGHSNSTASYSKASFFSFPLCELLRPVLCKWYQNNTFTYNVRPKFCPKILYPSKIGNCAPTAQNAGLTVLIAQPLHVSKKPGLTGEEREHCVPSISFVLGDFFKGKWCEGKN